MTIANAMMSITGKLPFGLRHPLRILGRYSADRFDAV